MKCCHELDEISLEPKHETAAKAELQAMRMSVLNDSRLSLDARRVNVDEERIFDMITSIKNRVAKISDSSSGGISKSSDMESRKSDTEEEPIDQTFIGLVLSFTSNFFGTADDENTVMIENLPSSEIIEEDTTKKLLSSDSYLSTASMDFDAELVFNKLDTDKDDRLDYIELNDLLKLSEVKVRSTPS